LDELFREDQSFFESQPQTVPSTANIDLLEPVDPLASSLVSQESQESNGGLSQLSRIIQTTKAQETTPIV
jgi:hypothetical protein